jgi:hypothetical protein
MYDITEISPNFTLDKTESEMFSAEPPKGFILIPTFYKNDRSFGFDDVLTSDSGITSITIVRGEFTKEETRKRYSLSINVGLGIYLGENFNTLEETERFLFSKGLVFSTDNGEYSKFLEGEKS